MLHIVFSFTLFLIGLFFNNNNKEKEREKPYSIKVEHSAFLLNPSALPSIYGTDLCFFTCYRTLYIVNWPAALEHT